MPYTLITGASSGIGEAFARELAAQRHNLVLVARSENKLENLADELRDAFSIDVKVISLDLAKIDSAENLFEECRRQEIEVNFLINDAGIGLIGKFDRFEIGKIEEMINLNVLTLTKLFYLFLPHLRKHQGTVINVASQVAFSPAPYMSAYAGTKAYVLHFTEGIRVEYEKEGVKILALCPGPTYTNFFEKTKASPSDINFKFRPPQDVVTEALNAIEKNRAVVVVGWENKLMVFLLRFLPRSLVAKYSATMVKNGENRP